MLCAVLLAFLGIALSVSAQAASQSITIGTEQAIGLAAKWVVDKELDPASQMLVELEEAYPQDPQVIFLRRSLRSRRATIGKPSRYSAACCRGIRAGPRIRLKPARALFATRDYEAARYHFEIAMGQTLDERVRENVYAFLRAIRESKKFL